MSQSFRAKVRSGDPVLGSWVNTGSPIVAELMAGAGFDFLCVDVEHSPVDAPQTHRLFQAITSGNPNCHGVVRLHGVDFSHVKRYLDAGAHGVIAPLVSNKEQAQLLVEATKYPPLGRRGVGFCRANNYGADLKRSVETANDDIMVAVQIEDMEGVEKIDEIISTPGIDAVFIGPYDLSASLGVTAQFDHPDFLAARDAVLAACNRHDVVSGIHVVHPIPSEVLDRIADGYRLLAYSLDITMLMDSCARGLGQIRQELPSVLK